jgi:diguanylate cyclase
VSETPDWKQKYRDSLLEMESEEKRWRQIEQALRRLVGRLCAAGMGVDPQLDDELKVLAAANRRNAAAEELEQLAASLTTVVVAVDAVSPVAVSPSVAPRIVRWDSTCAAVGGVLQHLNAADPEDSTAEQLLARLPLAASDAALAAIVVQAADLIHELVESFARERLNSAAVLSQVTLRLEEMAGYLTTTGEAARTGFEDSACVNDTVISQVRELSAEVDSATELSVLQSLVSARLEAVTRQVLDFRAREEARKEEQAGRTERMYARIVDLEREAQELHSKLDREKHVARHDPLTRLANRKSFDERFAEEILHRSLSDVPVAMLLWDIDDFKAINDSYGHRAGDRVLQTVAACFVSGLRAEDFVARIGGEEFVVLMRGLTPEIALRIANELRAAVAALRFHFRATPVRVTVSCGLTELRQGDATGAAFDRADAALYRAKREGKNLCIAA